MIENHPEVSLQVLLKEIQHLLLLLGGTAETLATIPLFKRESNVCSEELLNEVFHLSTGLKGEEKQFKEKYREAQPLSSILQHLNKNEVKQKHYYPMRTLSLRKDFFPTANASLQGKEEMLTALTSELQELTDNSNEVLVGNLLTLLLVYGSSVAALPELPDISFYDLAKTKANVAAILSIKELDEQNPFLLVGGDFSGIQPYIYQIVSKFAGKNLKGRSYYLRILGDAVVRFIQKELHLSSVSTIYNSGGSFYLLLPNTVTIEGKLTAIKKQIEKKIFKAHGATLYLSLAHLPLSKETLINKGKQSLSEQWSNLIECRNSNKHHHLATLIKESYNYFFEPSAGGGNCIIDHITGEEILDPANALPFNAENKELKVSSITKKQIDLGKRLRSFSYLVITQKELPELSSFYIEPAGFGFYYYLLKQDDLKKIPTAWAQQEDIVEISCMNAEKQSGYIIRQRLSNFPHGIKFYGGNESTSNTFEELCNNSTELDEEDSSFKRLGVLRMDVDSLGAIFQKGIPSSKLNLAKYSSLSRSFDYFFSGYLNTLVKTCSEDQLFTIYSGGDDLFIVGQWEKTIHLAEKIKEEFSTYSNNPLLSISGGISIIPPKFPIMKGAEFSATQESLAKEHKVNGAEKNSISFFSTPLNWDLEFTPVKELKERLEEEIVSKRLPSGFLQRVMRHAQNAGFHREKLNEEAHKITNYKIYWMISYEISRLNEQCKNPILEIYLKDIYASNKQLMGKPIQTKYHALELWAFAARWCELSVRDKN